MANNPQIAATGSPTFPATGRSIAPRLSKYGALASLCALACASPSHAVAGERHFSSERITVRIEGKGDDVILIPGIGCSPRVWSDLLRFVPGHRYHLVQISGFAGQATRGNSDGPVAAPVAEEIARYIATAHLSKPAVIGHSLGGLVGLMLAARHPAAVSRLMVVDVRPFMGAAFGPPGTTPESIKPVADSVMAQMEGFDTAARLQNAHNTIDGMINTVDKRPEALQEWMHSDPHVVAHALHEGFVTDLGPELPNIAARTVVLYVTAKNNQLSEQQTDAAYQDAYRPLKEVALKHIPDSAHFIMWDQPELFRQSVAAFLF